MSYKSNYTGEQIDSVVGMGNSETTTDGVWAHIKSTLKSYFDTIYSPVVDTFTAPYGSENSATSNIALDDNSAYILYTYSIHSSNYAYGGQYYVARKGSGSLVNAAANDEAISVTIDGSFKVVITNTSGGGKALKGVLYKVF